VPRDFIGREEEIEQIRDFVAQSTKAKTTILTVVLFGLPVVGKYFNSRSQFFLTFIDLH
jgi:AAA+ ATPase superfamily predicted ATPase